MTETTLQSAPRAAEDRDLLAALLTRGTVIAALVAIALVHVVQLPDTYRQTPGLGVLFTALVLTCFTIAGALLHLERRILWYAAGATAAATIGGYVMTRAVAVPFDRQDVGNWLEPIGLVALFLEAGVVVLCVYRLRTVPLAWEQRTTPLVLAQLNPLTRDRAVAQ